MLHQMFTAHKRMLGFQAGLRATVPVEVVEKPKENTMSQRDVHTFTLNLKNLIRIAMNDPACRAEMKAALLEGAMPHTEKLGAANLKEDDEGGDAWYTVFAGTAQGVQPGSEGFILRNQDGTRISMRLRRQQRKHQAATSAPAENQAASANSAADLIARALAGDAAVAQAVLQLANAVSDNTPSSTPALQETPAQENIEVPAEDPFAEIVNEPVAPTPAASEPETQQIAAAPMQPESETVSGELFDNLEEAVNATDPAVEDEEVPTL